MTDKLMRLSYPVIGTVGILVLWQAYVGFFDVSPVVLPSPYAVGLAMVKKWRILADNTWITFLECVYGFGLAIGLGIPIAVALTASRLLRLMFYPILIASQSVPKIAIAPIMLVWLGFGLESKLAIAFLVAFFPVVIDTATGLRSTPPGLIELAQSLKASPLQTFMKLRFPAALPFVFSGAKVAVTLAVIGAVIGEFVGATGGLGNLLLVANSQLDGPLAWASLVWLSVLGIVLFAGVVIAERLIMPWGVDSH